MKFRIVISAIALATLLSGCGVGVVSPEQDGTVKPSSFLNSESIYFEALDFKTYESRILLTNTGDKPLKVACELTAKDSGGVQLGWAFEELAVSIEPGKQDILASEIVIDPVTDSTGVSLHTRCIGEFTSSDTFLAVSEVSDCSFYPESDKIGPWGPCFSAPESFPSLEVNCHIVALDASGSPFLARRFSGRVFSSLAVGETRTTSPNVTAKEVERISSYSIKCFGLLPQ
jgi:hypothetical protein